jgi:hypothetical protein
VEGPGGTEGSGEGQGGWEAVGSPGKVPLGSRGGEGKVCVPGGPVGNVCTVDRFVPKSSWRRWSAGLGGDADGGPGQEVQLTGASGSPWGL